LDVANGTLKELLAVLKTICDCLKIIADSLESLQVAASEQSDAITGIAKQMDAELEDDR
jgi:hypothetical protein